ncbi:unnamed protein product [Lathyrus oleraceus]
MFLTPISIACLNALSIVIASAITGPVFGVYVAIILIIRKGASVIIRKRLMELKIQLAIQILIDCGIHATRVGTSANVLSFGSENVVNGSRVYLLEVWMILH